MTWGAAAARASAEAIRRRAGSEKPACAIVLGSGLGGLAARIGGAVRIPYGDVPGFPGATVAGHEGTLVVGTLAGRRVACLAGRFHMYEGHPAALAAFPARVLHALGAPVIFVSNAAGGVRRSFGPGDLMTIADHINLMWVNPLTGPVEPGDERFPDMSAPYDAALRAQLHAVAARERVPLAEGVYCGLLGPTYETPAEVRMLETLGADAVGMSTVPEVIVARAIGMRVAGVSLVTNKAAGISPEPIDHAHVVAVGKAAAERFERLVTGFVGGL
ncbi:MAG: purine-nucleoside phosphorylase [Gemmatimonadetes bacterium]|nr:purine-nucleoside phosphorylase [Gemmatimonadota bacterium]